MNAIPVLFERRKTVRLPVPNSLQDGELRFGDLRFPVQLIDQSAEGFAAMSLQAPTSKIGAKGLLRAGGDWFEIFLTSVKPLMFPGSEKTGEEQEQYFRLGLCRLRDAADPDKKQTRWSRPRLTFHLRQIMSPSSTMLGFGVLFALFVLLLPTVAVIFFYSRSGNFVGDALRFTKRLGVANSPENMQSNPRDSSSSTPYASLAPQRPLDINQQGKPPFQTPVAEYLNKLRDIIRRMPGASVFLAPNVIQELGITDQQQKKIQNLVDATAEAMGKLREQLNDKNIHMQETINQELLDIARDSALKLLTPEQQARWQKLIAENPPHEIAPIKEEKK